MISSLLAYLRGINHTTKKDDIIKTAEFNFINLSENVLPALSEIKDKIDLTKSSEVKILTNIGYTAKVKYKDANDLFNKIYLGMVDINKNRDTLFDLINTQLSSVITDKAASAKDIAIMKIVNDLGAMNNYIMDLSYLLIIDKSNTDLPKIKLEEIRAESVTFAETFGVYGNGNFANILKECKQISSNTIDINDGTESMGNIMLARTGKMVSLPTASGFVNNPIYHVRMWLIDREVRKLESLKEKKRLIDLRVMELKLAENKESDPSLRKQIEYYEDKLSKLEYEIRKIEGE